MCIRDSINAEYMGKEQLAAHCDSRGVNIDDFSWNSETFLVRNACLCPACPHYLVPDNSLSQHLQAHDYLTTALHKTARLLKQESPEKIWEDVIHGTCYDLSLPILRKVTPEIIALKDRYISLIVRLRKFYNEHESVVAAPLPKKDKKKKKGKK
eukprot:TRINITY_DN3560_c0_g1_i1.p1 TRINITY_DN3560_c0_g1~~TRINITY_DN3560_c0_g1_i1.p1  ORF type:complete len:154 (+),score=30.46 TRINITY_DN3560_c0_g1_i1:65-526(+)